MKRILALMLIGVMVFALAACAQKTGEESAPAEETPAEETVEEASDDAAEEAAEEAEPDESAMVGAYERAESPVVTDEVKELVAKASETMLGAEYTPVAYIGSQVVAGTNHLVLCVIKTVTEEPKSTYALVTIYEDLDGNAQITDVLNSDAEEGPPDLMGGWQTPETPEVTEEAAAALEKASEKLLGAEYEPVALIATQVVAGTNYNILCSIKAVAPDAEAKYSLVTVYEDLEGNAEVSGTYDFAVSEE